MSCHAAGLGPVGGTRALNELELRLERLNLENPQKCTVSLKDEHTKEVVNKADLIYLVTVCPQIVGEDRDHAAALKKLKEQGFIYLELTNLEFSVLFDYFKSQIVPLDYPYIFENVDKSEFLNPYLLENLRDLFKRFKLLLPSFSHPFFCEAWITSVEQAKIICSIYQGSLKEGEEAREVPEFVQQARSTLEMVDFFGSEEKTDQVLKEFADIAKLRRKVARDKAILSMRQDMESGAETQRLEASDRSLIDRWYELIRSMDFEAAGRYFFSHREDRKNTHALRYATIFVDLLACDLYEFISPDATHNHSIDVLQALFFDHILVYYGFVFDPELRDYVHVSKVADPEKRGLFSVIKLEQSESKEFLEEGLRKFLVEHVYNAEHGQLPKCLYEDKFYEDDSLRNILDALPVDRELQGYEQYTLIRCVLEIDNIDRVNVFDSLQWDSYKEGKHVFRVDLNIASINPHTSSVFFLTSFCSEQRKFLTKQGRSVKPFVQKLERLGNETPPPLHRPQGFFDQRWQEAWNVLVRLEASVDQR